MYCGARTMGGKHFRIPVLNFCMRRIRRHMIWICLGTRACISISVWQKPYTEENDWQSFSVHSSSPAKRCKAAVLPYRNAPERRHSPLP